MSGALGASVFLRRQSMAGDAIPHTPHCPGLSCFFATGQREPYLLLGGPHWRAAPGRRCG
jgi:ABC-type Mn2+/Zn2+ transport system permease subunit